MCKVAHPPSMGLPEPLKTLPIISLDTGVLRTCIQREQEVTTLLIYLNLIHHAAVPDTGAKQISMSASATRVSIYRILSSSATCL